MPAQSSFADLRHMQLHLEALYTFERGRIAGINQWDGGTPPRFHLGRTREGHIAHYHADLPQDLVRRLNSLVREEPVDPLPATPKHHRAYVELLAGHAPVQHLWQGPAFALPAASQLPPSSAARAVSPGAEHYLEAHLADWIVDVGRRTPLVIAMHNGHAVAVCASARATADACEAGVETAAAFRRQGHAARAVSTWAELVRSSGRVPLYSTSWDNVASQALAARLGFTQIGSDFHVR